MSIHEAVHEVFFDDLDAVGILHNVRYLLLAERTIGGLWAKLGFTATPQLLRTADRYHLVRANHIEYLRAVEGTGLLNVRVWVDHLGTSSLTFGFSIVAHGQDVEHAKGTRTIVCVDPVTKRPVPWSPEFRRDVAPYCRA